MLSTVYRDHLAKSGLVQPIQKNLPASDTVAVTDFSLAVNGADQVPAFHPQPEGRAIPGGVC
jgi:hypothetical protein